MNYKLFCIVMLLGINKLFAQVVLTTDNFFPKPGDVLLYYNCDTSEVYEGNGGINQLWDFSGLTITTGWVDTLSYHLFLDSSINDSFPGYSVIGVNHFSYYNAPAYIYYNRNDSFILAGTYHYYPIPPTKFVVSQTNMVCPFTYSSTFTDSLVYFQTRTRKEWDTVICDGYGKLVTPFATYDSVLRLHLHGYYYDTTPGSYPHFVRMSIDSFAWFTPGVHGSLLGITRRLIRTERDTILIKTVTLGKQYFTTRTQSFSNRCSIDLVPNPASDYTYLIANCCRESIIALDVYNMNGKKVIAWNYSCIDPGKLDLGLDLRHLSVGVYICAVRLEDGEIIYRNLEVKK